MKVIKVNLKHYHLESQFHKKLGKMMCEDEAQLWADAYINDSLLSYPYDLDLRIYKSLPYSIRRLVRIKLKSVYHIRIS